MKGEVKLINGKRVATPEYRSWQMMKNRCSNPRAVDWAYYGGRGISFDPRWQVFEEFLADMGRRPGPKYTLERKDGSKNYTKENCEWATRQTQSRNRAYVKLSLEKARAIRSEYAAGGVRQIDIARRYGVSQILVSVIIRGRAWSEEVVQ